MKSGALRTMSIRGDELDLAANYLANRFGKGSSRIVLRPGVLSLAASVEVPASPFGTLRERAGAVARDLRACRAFEELRIGRLPVPNLVADWALAHACSRSIGTDEYRIAADSSAASASPTATCGSSTNGATICRPVGNVLVPPRTVRGSRVYQERLVQWTRDSTLAQRLAGASCSRR